MLVQLVSDTVWYLFDMNISNYIYMNEYMYMRMLIKHYLNEFVLKPRNKSTLNPVDVAYTRSVDSERALLVDL